MGKVEFITPQLLLIKPDYVTNSKEAKIILPSEYNKLRSFGIENTAIGYLYFISFERETPLHRILSESIYEGESRFVFEGDIEKIFYELKRRNYENFYELKKMVEETLKDKLSIKANVHFSPYENSIVAEIPYVFGESNFTAILKIILYSENPYRNLFKGIIF